MTEFDKIFARLTHAVEGITGVHGDEVFNAQDDLRAILALAAPAEGYVLVPVEPTEAMILAGAIAAMEAATPFMDEDFWKARHVASIERMKAGDFGSDDEKAKGVACGAALYRAMIAACLPAAPTGEAL